MSILLISIILEFVLSQLFHEFVPRLDLLSIVTLNVMNPFTLFAFGLIKDIMNIHILGFSSLLYLVLFILHQHYKFSSALSLISIFLMQWVIDTVMFSEYQESLRNFMTNSIITLIVLQGLRFSSLKTVEQ